MKLRLAAKNCGRSLGAVGGCREPRGAAGATGGRQGLLRTILLAFEGQFFTMKLLYIEFNNLLVFALVLVTEVTRGPCP
jgi:hypothetical protein